jgi:hypothetical protein
MCAVLKGTFSNIFSDNGIAVLRPLNCITESIQVTEGRKYFLRGPHVGQAYSRKCLVEWTAQFRRQRTFATGICKSRGEILSFEDEGYTDLWNVRNNP